MSIYRPKKKIRKVASGINTDQLKTSNEPIGGNLREGVRKGVGAIPVWGQIAEANMAIADGIRGDGSNKGKNVAAGFADPASVFLEGLNKGKVDEMIPIYGQFAQAKRLKKEADKKELQAQAVEIADANKQSNSMFGKLTYANGGETPDMAPSLSGVQDKAVVLDGDRHKDGGNDVLDAKTGEKVAETESDELIFTRKQTDQIEAYITEYYQKDSDESLYSLGALVKNIVDNDMIDYSEKFSK